jgi:UDP-N-acetylmuramyl pentapeptide phosphotransferase/UDP-N-acetylglucosamine-1-phosphate transferase
VSSNIVYTSVLAVLVASFAVCAILVLTQRWHGAISLDHDLTGAQKIHQNPVPRVGGVGVMAGLLMGVVLGYNLGGTTWPVVIKLLMCAIPAFTAGLIEDLTKKVSVRARLLASFVSAAMATWVLDASLLRLDTPYLDHLMTIGPVAILFTCFAVGGMTNAINIIDGLNGLASGAVALMLAGLGAIAWQFGDYLVFELCLWGIGAMVGFMLLNYPFGRIFLGDGGAYLAGFWLAECAVLLLNRNPNASTWAVLLCVMYPAWETIYSMYRRQFKDKTDAGAPDSEHFHHLVLKCVERLLGPRSQAWQRHGLATLTVWGLAAVSVAGGIFTTLLNGPALALTVIFAGVYVLVYSAIPEQNDADEKDDTASDLELNSAP